MPRIAKAHSLARALLAFALALTLGGSATAPAIASVSSGVGVACADPGSATSAKARPGARVTDPNALSDAQVAAREKAFTKGAVAKGLGHLRSDGTLALTAAAVSATIPVYVHEILSAAGAGDVPSSRITAQVKVLNDAYAPSRIQLHPRGR